MLRWLGLLSPLWVGCALPQAHAEDESPLGVVDERLDPPDAVVPPWALADLEALGDKAWWRGDTLTVDSRCLMLEPHAGSTLDEVCDELFGGTAFVGEDRVAATVFDDAECLVAAGFLPDVGGDGTAVVPRGGLGLILRCAVFAEPR
ncbi:MAG: hypothetical protein AB8H79_01125 [Myxococcota bacterium]